jgi:hypothetical protein
MKNTLLFKHTKLGLIIAFVLFSSLGWGQGAETFTSSSLTASYATGNFTGDNAFVWSYVASRNESTYGITGKGIMFEGVVTAKLTSASISGGIGSFTCKLKKAFTGAGNRQVELFINGISKGTSIAWDNTTVQTFTITDINVVGNIIIEIKNKSTKQLVIDDISWTGYVVPTNTSPTVTNSTASAITATAATLAGNVTATGGASIAGNGSVYSLTTDNAAPQIAETLVTQVATTTPGAGTGTFSNAVSTTLLVNRQYSYNAYATNSEGTSYGAAATFYTLAKVPNAPTVSNPTTSTLDVAIASADGNPTATEYAIQETISGNYVQLNGTLNATAVWQTAATWGTKTVTGLTSNTSYTFAAKAKNGAAIETIISGTNSGTTSVLTAPTISGATTATVFTTFYGTTSAVQTFSISGVNLTTAITATAPTGFLVSSDGITYGTTATFALSGSNAGGSLSVILAATAEVSVSYNSKSIVLSSAGATDVSIATTATGNGVAPAPLTIIGLTASDKTYDRTTSVTIFGTPTFSGLKNGENFTPSDTVTWAFANALVASGKTITRTGTFSAPNTNYSISQPTLTASITALMLTTTGTAAVTSKNYDGTTAATLSGIALVGVINLDVVNISGVFNDKTVNADKPVSLSLVGGDISNYSWTAPTGSLGTITTAPLTISNVAVANKLYDGTNTATITGTLTGIVVGETVTLNGTGTFASSAVANGISVTSTATLAATDSGNYTLTQPTGLTGNIIVQEAGLLLLEDNIEANSGLLTTNGWTQISTTTTNPVNSGTGNGLSYTNYGSSSLGNAAILSTGQDVYKTFAPQNPGLGSSTIYYSALVQVSNATTGGDYFLALGESSTFTGSATYRSRIYTKRGSTVSKIVFGISTNGTIKYSTTEYDVNTTILLAVKHIFTTTTSTSSLFINPSVYSEPNSATIFDATDSTVSIGLNSIALRQGGATSAPTLVIDGIRVATNWGALLGNPQYAATSNIAAGNYNTVNVISGAVTALGNVASKTLNIESPGSLSVTTGNNLTINGAITNTGTLTIANNANLIQGGTTNSNTGSGSTIVNRNSASIYLYDYTLWSSPVAGQKLKAFSPETLNTRFYSYNSGTNLYNVVPLPVSTDFAIAKGYLIRTPNTWTAATPMTFNGIFTGVPNNGDIELTGLTAANFYAVGNPYPSTISVASFYTANPNAGTLYFWRKTNGASGTAYATKNNTGATASGGYTPSADIAVGQGFIVAPGAATLNFNNAMRAVPSTSAVFLRTASEERNRFWLNLTNTSGLFCQMLVGYLPNATSGVDNAIDGRYFNDAPTAALTSIINDQEYTIQGRALPFSSTDIVPLGFKTNVAGNYNITIDHIDGLFSTGQSIFLKDNLLSTVTDLSAGSYSFVSAIGTFNSRFEIVYDSTLGTTNPTFTANSVIAFSDNGEIRINSGTTIMDFVRIYDLQGRLLVEKKYINSSDTKITTTAKNQVLLVEITAANGTKITKKIIQ